MIRVNVYRNNTGDILGFRLKGHADYAEEGSDIVCSAVSVLTINTINSIELFTDEEFECKTDEKKGGFLSFSLKGEGTACRDAQLLLKAMLNGLNDIQKEYSFYISINEEVR
ncbi:MAG: ribosomal-processing cysteine protease Prp [Clostridiales bacterium]|nr:ribosomal-processing cysteine protease Prp [Clostridiales bacterium]